MVEIDARNDAQKTMLDTSQEVMCDFWRRGQLTPVSVQLWTAGATAPLIKRQHSTKPCGYKLRPIGVCEVLPTMLEGTYHQADAASTIQARPWTHIETKKKSLTCVLESATAARAILTWVESHPYGAPCALGHLTPEHGPGCTNVRSSTATTWNWRHQPYQNTKQPTHRRNKCKVQTHRAMHCLVPHNNSNSKRSSSTSSKKLHSSSRHRATSR